MKKLLLNALAFCAMSAMLFTSCENNVNDDNDQPSANELSGAITSVKELDANVTYTLNGTVTVEEGGELVIPAGTVIKCRKGFSNYLLVLPGGKIMAEGTAEKPIVFTADVENAGSGYWGGIIINGKAPISGAEKYSTALTEVNNAYIYGGNDAEDNSGVLKYVKIEYAGARSTAEVEHNGLTLNAVGNGTVIENIYVLESADDAIEFFGGSVNVTNLLAVNSDDDMFDFTQGYTGTLKNCYGVWAKGYTSTESDPRGIEADGNFDGMGPDHVDQSNFKVENMTVDLRLDYSDAEGSYMHDVIKLRRGATANITNALLKGVGAYKDIIDLTDGKGDGTEQSSISISNENTGTALGKEINITDGKSYPNVKVEAGNTGCDATLFGWTGYTL